MISITTILGSEDIDKIIRARKLKQQSQAGMRDDDFEDDGAYADDEDCKHEESYRGHCIVCGEPYQMG